MLEKFPSVNFAILSRLANHLSLSDQDIDLVLREVMSLDPTSAFPVNCRELRKAEDEALKNERVTIINCPIAIPLSPDGHRMCENRLVRLHHFDIWELCCNLLEDAEHRRWCKWSYEPSVNDSDSRQYGEMWTANWWRQNQSKLPSQMGSKLLCILLASDETQITLAGRKVHPVYLTLGNLHREYRQKASGRKLFGFIPVITPVTSHSQNQTQHTGNTYTTHRTDTHITIQCHTTQHTTPHDT